MSDITIQIGNITARTVRVSKGDRVKIIGTFVRPLGIYAGIYSSFDGNFPPEIGKTSSYWKAFAGQPNIYEMIDYVQLNTLGTYTFKTAMNRQGTFETGQYLTLIVEEPTLSVSLPVNVNGTWKDSTPSVNVNGSWKEVSNAYVNVNGSWKEI